MPWRNYKNMDTVKMKKEKKFIVKTFDGDIYIVEGYTSQEEVDAKLAGLEKARMPNGDIIKTSSIAKIQSFESYRFQSDQRERHKRGQYIAGGNWHDTVGLIGPARLESISGKVTVPALSSGKGGENLLDGKK